jgi:hypothetical protein
MYGYNIAAKKRHIQGNYTMSSITFGVENEKHFSSRIQNFFKEYQSSNILKKVQPIQKAGLLYCYADSVPVLPHFMTTLDSR